MARYGDLTLALAATLAAACADDGRQGATSVVRDSAGVIIVENAAVTWDTDAGWRISEEPVFDVGLVDGPVEYQLYRAYSAVRLPDGRVVIANGGTNELRFYDRTGQHLLSVGREGEGPAEFRDLQRVSLLPGDSLLAYDFFPSRLSVFTAAGQYVRSFHVASPEGRQIIVRGAFSDGSLIAAGAPIWGAPGATSGVVRDSVPYYRFDADGSLIATLGLFPSVEVYRVVTGDDWRLTSLAFPRAPIAAVAGDRFHFGAADTYEIRTYTAAGRLERVLRLPHSRRAVTPEDIAEFRRERLEQAEREGTRASMERMLSAMPYPEMMPPYERAIVDDGGNLWVADYRASPREDPTWKVFSADGSFLGAVTLPAGFELDQIGADFVLGRWIDDLEVEHIRMYALTRQ